MTPEDEARVRQKLARKRPRPRAKAPSLPLILGATYRCRFAGKRASVPVFGLAVSDFFCLIVEDGVEVQLDARVSRVGRVDQNAGADAVAASWGVTVARLEEIMSRFFKPDHRSRYNRTCFHVKDVTPGPRHAEAQLSDIDRRSAELIRKSGLNDGRVKR